LVVIGIIAILATIVIIAINPARQFSQTRDTQRVSHVNSVLNAIGQRIADCKGIFEGACGGITCPTLPISVKTIIYSGTPTATEVDLSCLVPTYISSALNDPKPASLGGYTVIAAAGRITVAAPAAEITTPISVTR
jgi:type IV pilus assembly protein PilA